MNHLLNVLDGFASVFGSAACNRRPYVNARGGFYRDQQKLRKDIAQTGSDLKKAADTYGKQSITGAGYK